MATADGMEGASVTQTMSNTGQGVKSNFAGAVASQALKELSTPELWAGAVAGFVAGTAVGWTANRSWKTIKGLWRK